MEHDLQEEMSNEASVAENQDINKLRNYINGKLENYFDVLDINLSRIVEKEPDD